MILVTLLAGLVVIGVQPFDLDQTGAAIGTAGAVVVVVALATVSFLKGRLLLGAISIFVPVVGLVAAARLAKPNSPWARRRYRGPRAHRLERARERHERDTRLDALGLRVRDAIGGAPTPDDETSPSGR